MDKVKVFISVPMGGRADEEIRHDIDSAKIDISNDPAFEGCEVEIIDNFIEKPEGVGKLYCLGEAIKKLGDCDYVFMCPGWKLAKGCHVEMAVASNYSIPVFGHITAGYYESANGSWRPVY